MTAPVGHNGGPPIDPPARKRGRPSLYTPEVAAIIWHRLAEAESLASICRGPGMPSKSAMLSWVRHRPEFRRQYDQARVLATHTVGDDVLAIAENVQNTPGAIKEARRLIDAKKWHLARMAPKRRGPRPVVEGEAANIRTNTHEGARVMGCYVETIRRAGNE